MSRRTCLLLLMLGTLASLPGCSSSDDDKAPATTTGTADKRPAGDWGPQAAPVKVPLTQAEITDGWISLFDGNTLTGWTPNSDADWRVEDGVIVASSGGRGLLVTAFEFADYEFRCDFRVAEGGNSGVFLRTAEKPSDPSIDCYELNMCDTHESFGTGSLVGRAKAENVPPTDGEWHSWTVLCSGPQLKVQLDGNEILDFTDDGENIRLSGHIGLQLNQGRVEFRNIVLKPLNLESLFDGQTLDGWREVPGGVSKFVVDTNEIHVTNGPGFLETERTFADFILQTEIRTGGDGLNSGIFFRAMPGTAEAPSHGYEMQVQNAVKDGDPTQPVDWGTGAIFRRQPARRVVSSDHKWFTATLIAQRDRIATWIDGYQVVDWKDDREDDPNPRKGRRLEAGHISLQGHDPTTDLRFRRIRAVENPSGQE